MIRLVAIILLLMTTAAVAQVGQVYWPNLWPVISAPPPAATHNLVSVLNGGSAGAGSVVGIIGGH